MTEEEEIYYEIETSTWFRRQSLKSYEGLFFALYTFSRRQRGLIRAPNAASKAFVEATYAVIRHGQSWAKSGLQKQ